MNQSSDYARMQGVVPAVEVIRRIVLIVALAAAAWLAFLSHFQPSLQVSPADPADIEQEMPAQGASPPASADQSQSLLSQDEQEEARSSGRKPLIVVKGKQWQDFFAAVHRSFDNNLPESGWEHRIATDKLEQAKKHASRESHDDHDFFKLWFFADEAPLNELSSRLKSDSSCYLSLDGDRKSALEIFYSSGPKLTGFNNSLSGVPEAFSYPYRHYSLWVALAGILAYLLLPWDRRTAQVLAMSRWRIILSDLAASFLLFLPTFALPLAIVGGSVEAATKDIFFSLFFWLLSALGLVLVYWSMIWAVYRIVVSENGFRIVRLEHSDDFSIADLEFAQSANFAPPVWLKIAHGLAATTSSSSAQFAGVIGAHMLLESSQGNGVYLQARDGRNAYIWFTDPSGNICLSNWSKFVELLEKNQIPFRQDVIQLQGIFPPFTARRR